MIQKSYFFLNKKNVKIKIKQKHAFKGFGSTYNNAEILNSFISDLLFKDIEYEIERKLIELLTQLKGAKFVTTLFLVFKNIEDGNKTNFVNFYSSSKTEKIISEVDIDDGF